MTPDSTNPANEAVELLPCPFCGGDGYLSEGHRDHWEAECELCCARRGRTFAGEDARRLAAVQWNTRTPPPPQPTPPADAEVEAILAMSDKEVLATSTPEELGWARGIKQGTYIRA